ncbi:MAG: molybdenum cofactor guanylyltransferase [Acidocella sp.]|nr:molybdenum cofactor guanylyltransferase [Acidocella sp.]
MALILAGGRATRFGADKAFAMLHGQPLVAHLIACLRPQLSQIAISANGEPSRFSAYQLPVLADTLPERGPLAGIAAGLGWAQAQGAAWMLSVPVDTPLIPATLLADLSPGPSVAVHAGRQHHLVALWPVSCLPALNDLNDAPGDHRVRDALALCHARPVTFIAANDPFLNINTPDDLDRAAAGLR